MEYLSIAIGVVILYLVHKVILTPMRHLVVNVIIGLIVLYGVNHFGYLFWFSARSDYAGNRPYYGSVWPARRRAGYVVLHVFLTYAKKGYREIKEMGCIGLYCGLRGFCPDGMW